MIGQPTSSSTQFEEVDIDLSGLPHAVVEQAENCRVRELVKKIENHPHRQALQDDLQQNNPYNPFSEKSKKMIKDMGNVELFELCETIPKVQCKECLLYWNPGIVYCTCGHLLRENQSSRGILQWTLDLLSIPNHVIKKGDLGEFQPRTSTNMRNQNPTKHINLDLANIDHVSSNVKHCGFSAVLYVFEDNEAVIKMIIKGRSPTMRHVSRTHRVAPDWLFDRMNLDPKNQIHYMDTKHQLADVD